MAEREPDRAELLRACQEAISRLVLQRGWMLLPQEQWAQQALDLVLTGQISDPLQAAVQVYCLSLYAACQGAEGPQRQSIGYQELFHYLYDGARRRHPQRAEELAQRAIKRVFRRFEHCPRASVFLAFAFQQLLEAARELSAEPEI